MAKPRLDGLLVSWNDERGFGFLRPGDGSPNLFAHISAFGAMATRPEVGDIVSYRPGKGKDGRPQALDIRAPGRLLRQPRRAGPASLLVVVAFVAACIYLNSIEPIHVSLVAIYAIASVVAFITYGIDKSRARAGRWRAPETTLLIMGLVGGWPGAIVAQQVFRHKTTKTSFRGTFWLTVVVNVIAFVAVATPIVRDLVSRL